MLLPGTWPCAASWAPGAGGWQLGLGCGVPTPLLPMPALLPLLLPLLLPWPRAAGVSNTIDAPAAGEAMPAPSTLTRKCSRSGPSLTPALIHEPMINPQLPQVGRGQRQARRPAGRRHLRLGVPQPGELLLFERRTRVSVAGSFVHICDWECLSRASGPQPHLSCVSVLQLPLIVWV